MQKQILREQVIENAWRRQRPSSRLKSSQKAILLRFCARFPLGTGDKHAGAYYEFFSVRSASQAASAANFSSCDHGAPSGLPSLLRNLPSVADPRRSLKEAAATRSRSLILLTPILQFVQAWKSASRKNSPSAV